MITILAALMTTGMLIIIYKKGVALQGRWRERERERERDCAETISILPHIFIHFIFLQYCSLRCYKSESPTVTERRESVWFVTVINGCLLLVNKGTHCNFKTMDC